MLKLKQEVSITEANNLLHSFAVVLDEGTKDKFYGHLQYARDTGDPKKIVEAVIANLAVLMEEVKGRAERQSDGPSDGGVQQQGG